MLHCACPSFREEVFWLIIPKARYSKIPMWFRNKIGITLSKFIPLYLHFISAIQVYNNFPFATFTFAFWGSMNFYSADVTENTKFGKQDNQCLPPHLQLSYWPYRNLFWYFCLLKALWISWMHDHSEHLLKQKKQRIVMIINFHNFLISILLYFCSNSNHKYLMPIASSERLILLHFNFNFHFVLL